MKEIAIIGTTASGKTALSIELASITNSIILSLDSMCVYKEANIVSAKPSLEERGDIIHFGIDEVFLDEEFDVVSFIEIYKKAKDFAQKNSKNLIIVGGTGFYLKALIDGLSSGVSTKDKIETMDVSLEDAYQFLIKNDFEYMQKIEKNDRYRVEKAYLIYKNSGLFPSTYFKKNIKTPIAPNLKIFEILWEKEELHKRIDLRTKQMIEQGLIDEIIYLEKKYSRAPNAMSSIGVVETLDYLDGKIKSKKELEEKIAQNTKKLAKRQNTFNKGQFKNINSNIITSLNSEIIKYFSI